MKRAVILGVVLVAVCCAGAWGSRAEACDCDYPRPFEEEAKAQPLVVHVRAHVTTVGREREVTFEVLRALKGEAKASAFALQWRRGWDCDHAPGEFREGQELVLVLKDEGGPEGVRLSGCDAVLVEVKAGRIVLEGGAVKTLDELGRVLGPR